MTEARSSSIAAFLPEMARSRPHAPAVIFPHGRDSSGRVSYTHLTYQQLDRDSDCIARGLDRIGLGQGVRVVLMVKPSLDFFALTFALFKAGTVPVMIDPGIDLKSLKQCLAEAEPAGFIGIPKAHVARLLFGWAKKSITTNVTVGRRWFWGGHTLDGIRRIGAEGPPHLAPTEADEVAAILFTSGSTGIPKGAVYRHGNFAAQVEMIRKTYGIVPGEIDLPTFPLFALFDPALGMTTVIPDMDAAHPARVDPAKLHEAIENFGVTNMFGSPAVLARLADHERPLPATLRRVLSAGAAVPPRTLARLQKLLPEGTQVFTPYGATESLPVASIGSDEILSETGEMTAGGAGICVGRPVQGVEVSIIEITDEPISRWEYVKLVPPGVVGEIVVRSPTVTTGYFRREHHTQLAKIQHADGEVAHRMGDLGYFDEHGRLWFCGRKSHRVETAGGTLFTEQVEGVFNAVSGHRTALVGVRGEPVVCLEWFTIVVVSDPHRDIRIDPEEMRRDILAKARQHAVARNIRYLLFHPGLFPVDIRHNSKIFREKLAVWAAKELK